MCDGEPVTSQCTNGATLPSYTANAKGAAVLCIAGNTGRDLYDPIYNGQLFEFAPGATTPTNSFLIVNSAFRRA